MFWTYGVLFVKWSADWSSSSEDALIKDANNTINEHKDKITIGVMIVADSGLSKFNQHLQEEDSREV